jgi:hypothetical protein
MTGSTLIYQSLRDLGVLRAGQTAAPETIADGLATLNQIVASWNTERLTVNSIAREVYDLTAGESTYYLGDDGGDSTRPTRIERAGYIAANSTIEDPVDVLTLAQGAAGREGVYNDAAAPVATFYVRPTPEGADQVVLYTWRVLAAFDLETAVSLAPGYEIALRFNLAQTLAPSMILHTKATQPLLARIDAEAQRTKAAIKSANITAHYLAVDTALRSYSDGRALFY